VEVFLRLLRYLKDYWVGVCVALGAMVAGTAVGMGIPWITRSVIDQLQSGVMFTPEEYSFIVKAALGIIGLTAARGVFQFLQMSVAGRVGQRCIFRLRNELYAHLHDLSFSFYDRAQTGELMSRITSDVETLRRFLGSGFMRLISSTAQIAGVMVMLFLMDWRLALASTASLPFMGYVAARFGFIIRPKYQAIRERMAEMTTTLQENLSGIRVVKAFAREQVEEEKFAVRNRVFLEQNIDMVRVRAFYFPMMGFIAGVGTTSIILYGGWLVVQETLTLGELVAFNSYLMMVIWPVRMLGWLINMVQQAQASGQRIFEILDSRSEITEKPGALKLEEVKGHVRFENVSFSYGEGVPVLRDINLDVKPGMAIALLGGTGSGKSTIINLIPRFYDPSEGRITLDGYDLRDLSLETVRSHIGIVSQETFLFSTTIAENIAYGKKDASREEIVAAARAAQIHEFIVSLPEGYDTVIGERGVGLSGGQRQRIAIARAILSDPSVLILDDSTSSVDMETEYLIQKALAEVMRNRTTFVIAQRLSTIKNADLIVVLDQGRIVQQGTHEQLLGTKGPYRQIYETQLKDQEESTGGLNGQTA